jgi:hypothetical protein
MEETITIQLPTALVTLQQHLWAYAQNQQKDVHRGLETDALAVLLVQKYGYGMVDTARELLGDEVATPLLATVDAAVAALDPAWPQHARQRWAARPARLGTD